MTGPDSGKATLDFVNHWCLVRMTQINRDILENRCPGDTFGAEMSIAVLPQLPVPESFSPVQARQLVVLLGLTGASVGRHYQEASQSHRATPREAFAGLHVGDDREPFRSYFARLANRTGTGHIARDSFASLVRWNVPAVEVECDGKLLTGLPSEFEDGLVRTYTGAADEVRFFGLLKASEALERAVNQQLIPLSEGSLELESVDALRAIERATVLLDALRELNHDFAGRPPEEGLQTTHFLDVFRQFAVHWELGDIPPSGALDAEALIRDLLVGTELPAHREHVSDVSPALLDTERAAVQQVLERVSLPRAALTLAEVRSEDLASASPADLRRLVDRYPILAALYRLLTAHARVAGVHLQLSKRFLFNPQRAREQAGLGDPGVVSNRIGTTGMDETKLERFTRARGRHLLAPLRVLPAHALSALACPDDRDLSGDALVRVRVRFTGSEIAGHNLGLPDRSRERPHGHPRRVPDTQPGQPIPSRLSARPEAV